MPIQLFVVLVFGICVWLSVGTIEPLMRSFSNEAELPTWLFVAIPGLVSMMFALFAYHRAPARISGMLHSLSRSVFIAIATWLSVAALIAWAWCPRYNAWACFSNTAIVSGIVAGGPLLIGTLLAGTVVGAVLRKRVPWLAYEPQPKKIVLPEVPARVE